MLYLFPAIKEKIYYFRNSQTQRFYVSVCIKSTRYVRKARYFWMEYVGMTFSSSRRNENTNRVILFLKTNCSFSFYEALWLAVFAIALTCTIETSASHLHINLMLNFIQNHTIIHRRKKFLYNKSLFYSSRNIRIMIA